MNIFRYMEYRKALRDYIELKKKTDRRLSYSRLSEQAGIQRSYLSNVLGDRADLNPDQLYLLAKALGLPEDAQEYLLLLLEIERCSAPERKQKLIRKRTEIQEFQSRSESSLGRGAVEATNEALSEYYSTALCPIVHVFLTIPENLKKPHRIADRLGISERELRKALSILERCGLLSIGKDGYRLESENLHLSDKSHLARTYATLFRLKAIEYQQKLDNPEDYFFSASFSADEKTRREIKERLLQFLKWLSKKVATAPSEEVFHLNLDLFRF